MDLGLQGPIRQSVESCSRFSRHLACEPVPCTTPPRSPYSARTFFTICNAVHQAPCSLAFLRSLREYILELNLRSLADGRVTLLAKVKVVLESIELPIVQSTFLANVLIQQFNAKRLEQVPGFPFRDQLLQVLNDAIFRESLLLQLNHTALQRHERYLYLLRKLFHLAAIRRQTLRCHQRFQQTPTSAQRVLASSTLALRHVHRSRSTC